MATIGLKNLVYSKLTKDDEVGVTYSEVKKIAPAINARISPKTEISNLYADDGAVETVTSLGEIEVELEISDLPIDIQADLQGHTVNAGVIIKKSTDTAPYVAIGFKSEKANGSYRYKWLYKGKFSLFEEEFKTKEDKVEFQTPKLKATFVKRLFDDAWEATADEDAVDFNPLTATNWFTSVFE